MKKETLKTYHLIREAIDQDSILCKLPLGTVMVETKRFVEELAIRALKASEEVA